MREEPSPFKTDAKPEKGFKLLPSDLGSEKGLLCSYLLTPLHVQMLCTERQVPSSVFHNPAHKLIFETIADMLGEGKPLDVVSLTGRLHDDKILDQVGGAANVSELFTFLPTAANAKFYIERLEQKALLREVIQLCASAENDAYDDAEPIPLIERMHGSFTGLTLKGVRDEKTFKDILMQTQERWQNRREGTGQQIRTGFDRLDHVSPLRRKHTLVISGREKSGKSALAGCIVKNVAGVEKLPTLVFSLEMPSEEWVDRLLSDVGSISQRRVHNGALEDDEWNDAAQAIEWLHGAPIEIHDSLLSLAQIVAKMRQWKTKNPDGAMVVIDYLQIMELVMIKGRTRENEVANMSKTLRNVGKELDVLMVELCQLNSADEARESKAIQQDCTAFWQVTEERDQHGNVPKGKEHHRTVHVRFQRHGARNVRIPFTFTGDMMRFTEEQMAEQQEML